MIQDNIFIFESISLTKCNLYLNIINFCLIVYIIQLKHNLFGQITVFFLSIKHKCQHSILVLFSLNNQPISLIPI